MTLSIIGAGFGRTGTFSLKLALEKLGYAPCYHGFEVGSTPAGWRFWERAFDGEEVKWDDLLGAYEAVVDFPACLFYRALAEKYPDGKVVLTVREPDAWYSSVAATFRAPAYLAASEELFSEAQLALRRKMLAVAFGDRLDDRESVIAAYERHNAAVRATIPADRLLVYQVSQGWEPLCEFLGVPVPIIPFPKSNSKSEWPRDPPFVRSFVADNITGRIPAPIGDGIGESPTTPRQS